jgi:hypothetical protein
MLRVFIELMISWEDLMHQFCKMNSFLDQPVEGLPMSVLVDTLHNLIGPPVGLLNVTTQRRACCVIA